MARQRLWIALLLFFAAGYAAATLAEQYCAETEGQMVEPCALAFDRAHHARLRHRRDAALDAGDAPHEDGSAAAGPARDSIADQLQRCFEPPARRRSCLCGS
jgi:hypothetical protein